MTNPRGPGRWTLVREAPVIADLDMRYHTLIGNLPWELRSQAERVQRAELTERGWQPVYDRNLGWIVQNGATLHIWFDEDTDGILRPARYADEASARRAVTALHEATLRALG